MSKVRITIKREVVELTTFVVEVPAETDIKALHDAVVKWAKPEDWKRQEPRVWEGPNVNRHLAPIVEIICEPRLSFDPRTGTIVKG